MLMLLRSLSGKYHEGIKSNSVRSNSGHRCEQHSDMLRLPRRRSVKNEEIQAAVDSVESAISNLAEETDAFRQSERWKRILKNVGKFHKYSITNQFLIAHQREGATYVAGFQRWKSLSRHVIKGAKGIRIPVPCAVKDRQVDEEGEREAMETGGNVRSKAEGAASGSVPAPSSTLPTPMADLSINSIFLRSSTTTVSSR